MTYNYTDAEWEKYCADNNYQLNYLRPPKNAVLALQNGQSRYFCISASSIEASIWFLVLESAIAYSPE